MYSWRLGDEPTARVTVRFEPVAPGGTEVTVFHERIASAAVRNDHDAGWAGCLDGLADWAVETDAR